MHRLSAHRVATHFVPGYKCFFGSDDTALHELAFLVWVVRSDASIGIVDAGLPGGADLEALRATGVYDDVVPLGEVYASCGLRPEQIDWCVITQPITYCTGGLVPHMFPRAHVYMAAAGLDELLHGPPGHPPAELYYSAATWSFLRELAIGGRLHLVRGEHEIAPGVVFEATGGHHPGSAAVRVATDAGVVAIVETAFLDENLRTGTPVGLAEDVARCRAVIARYVADYDLVVAGHDPGAVARFP